MRYIIDRHSEGLPLGKHDESRVILAKSGEPEEVVIELTEPGAELTLYVLGRAESGQTLSAKTRIIHKAPGTKSQTIVRCVALGDGHLSLSGAVELPAGAQGADGRFKADILLAGDNASAEAFPILEVGENEVSAAHSASVGRVSDEQLFYLQSRGLAPEEATALIVAGFFQPILAGLGNQTKENITKELYATR